MGIKVTVGEREKGSFFFWGSNMPAHAAVNILNLIHKGTAAMRPLATSTVATC